MAWLKIPTHSIRNKFESKAWDGIFLGYQNEASSYCILRVSDQKLLISKHVIFDENRFPSLPSQKQLTEDIARTLSYPGQSTEEETNSNSNTEDCSLSINSTSLDNESKEIFVDALEKKPKQI
ncbi:hypothetical protein O181_052014 [Austropuccinia psidii MF-1]|uniref:Retroviral polymerase SH3-like domain-containing protein n=1 Tax=Austropuccinia psidii MF-1 TaxID=1389203 RepID=A0A9Q3DZU7_9BASI|nr:hypothetical protein [Austropuccinia psidii MF-1]